MHFKSRLLTRTHYQYHHSLISNLAVRKEDELLSPPSRTSSKATSVLNIPHPHAQSRPRASFPTRRSETHPRPRNQARHLKLPKLAQDTLQSPAEAQQLQARKTTITIPLLPSAFELFTTDWMVYDGTATYLTLPLCWRVSIALGAEND